MKNIAIIGMGHLGKALFKGLINSNEIKLILNTENKVIRIMPNIPIAVCKGVIGAYQSVQDVTNIIQKLGIVIEVADELMLDLITIIGGCGPGIVAYLMNILVDISIEKGFSKPDASRIAQQLFDGTSKYIADSKITPNEMACKVATKGGNTESIINYYDEIELKREIYAGFALGLNKLQKY